MNCDCNYDTRDKGTAAEHLCNLGSAAGWPGWQPVPHRWERLNPIAWRGTDLVSGGRGPGFEIPGPRLDWQSTGSSAASSTHPNDSTLGPPRPPPANARPSAERGIPVAATEPLWGNQPGPPTAPQGPRLLLPQKKSPTPAHSAVVALHGVQDSRKESRILRLTDQRHEQFAQLVVQGAPGPRLDSRGGGIRD